MARKTYVPLLLKLSTGLCLAITRATPLITRLYPENTALLTALAAANAACGVLGEELAKVREYGD